MPAPKNLFTSVFKPAETVPDTEFDRFERFCPRFTGEPAERYAARLEATGLAFVVRSDDMHDDYAGYKSLLAAAENAGVPIAMLTAPIPNPAQERMHERATKSAADYLREARAQGE